MGIVCLDARRLSGRDVKPGYRRSPYCPSIRGFMSTARRIFNDGGAQLWPVAMCSSIPPSRAPVRCDIMAGNVNQTQPEATNIQTIYSAEAQSSNNRSVSLRETEVLKESQTPEQNASF